MKKLTLVALACAAVVALGSCNSEKPSQNSRSEPGQSSSEASFDLQSAMEKLAQGKMMKDSTGKSVPDADYLPAPSFGTPEKLSVFNPVWDTADGDYYAGTAFLLETDLFEEPVLVTACHIFSSDTVEVDPADLGGYVKGGKLYDIYEEGDVPCGNISGPIPVADAEPVDAKGSAAKDLAAFKLESADGLTSYRLASEPCKPGDMIYLVAYLSNEDSMVYDDCVYPCVVVSDDANEINYILCDEFITQGASGAPLLNDKGEVVGIHIGSIGSNRLGHSAASIYSQLKAALA